MRVDTHIFHDDGSIPNSPLPVVICHVALGTDAGAGVYEELFAGHGWLGACRDGGTCAVAIPPSTTRCSPTSPAFRSPTGTL
jgi:hypothetical protein